MLLITKICTKICRHFKNHNNTKIKKNIRFVCWCNGRDMSCVWMGSITGHGASGGRGLYNAVQSKAGYVSATFYLSTDDQLGVIVGQQGHGACSKVRLWQQQQQQTLMFRCPQSANKLLYNKRNASMRFVAWHSGRTSVFDRRTFPVLRSTCS